MKMEEINSNEKGLLGVVHLKRFYHQCLAGKRGETVTKSEQDWRFDNIVLMGLGLPLESTITWLLQNNPTFSEFENWILSQVTIDKLEIERINCALTRKPYSEEITRKLLEIEKSEDVLSQADLEFWDENGYVIIREAVPCEQAKAAEAAVWEFLEMSPQNPETWYEKTIGKGIMMDFYHHPILDANRKSARIRKAYAQLWKTADLWVTADRTSFNPPEKGTYVFQGPKLHWDMSLNPPYCFGTQGLLYLCDTAADQGAFRCVPKFQRRLENWLAGLPEGTNPRDVNLDDSAVNIAAQAGDFVIWHHALPHGSSPNRGNYPRIVQYMNMFPLDWKENLDWF